MSIEVLDINEAIKNGTKERMGVSSEKHVPHVVFCIPTHTQPHPKTIESLKAAVPLIQRAGWNEGLVVEVGCPYISAARATMFRKAMDVKADVVVFIDHDISFDPDDLFRIVTTPGDVIGGTYRFKLPENEEYMGAYIPGPNGYPQVSDDGLMLMHSMPAGFLKVTKEAGEKFLRAYPELSYGPRLAPCVDLFNHGAIDGVWYGEDYAFSKRYREKCGDIWCIPDLNLVHWDGDTAYGGTYSEYLQRQPGGRLSQTFPPAIPGD